MSKETVKLYSHDGKIINVIEVPKSNYDKNSEFLLQHNWLTYNEAKEDLELERKIERVINKTHHESFINNLSEDIARLERKLNGKDNRVDSLSDKIDNIKKDCKRGQDLLLDRIKELESELEPKEEEKVKKELNVFEIMLIGVVSWFLGFGSFHLLN